MDLSIYYLYPRSGKAARQKLDGSQIKPCLAAGDGPLKVPRQPPIAAKPAEGPLDHPASGQYLKTFGLVGSLDDLQRPQPAPGKRCLQLLAGVGAIGKSLPSRRRGIWRSHGKRSRIEASRSGAPSRSWMSAVCSWAPTR